MKQTVFVLLLATFSIRCTSDKQTPDDIPFIDVRKNYPEKETVLTDIASVTYLHLNTQNDDYLYRGGINYHTANARAAWRQLGVQPHTVRTTTSGQRMHHNSDYHFTPQLRQTVS